MTISRECDLSPHCEAWLRDKGFSPYAEVPLLGRCVDWVARSTDNVIRCVEMKLGLTKVVLRQAVVLQLVTEDVWCFVCAKPRSLVMAEKCGLGVARFDGTQVVELLQPQKRGVVHQHYYDLAVSRTQGEPGGIAGNPQLAGVGPAISVEAAVAAYRQAHPTAKWAEIFANVPNHYASAKSMQSAAYSNRQLRAFRERRRQARAGGAA